MYYTQIFLLVAKYLFQVVLIHVFMRSGVVVCALACGARLQAQV